MALAAQLLRDAGDGAHVVGDVLAGGAVTAGCGAHEGAVAVKQVHGQAVDLQLGEPARGGAGKVADALLGLGQPGAQLLEGEDVLEGVHAFQVGDGRESFDGFAADFLGGRVVRDDERVLRLNDFEAAVERIVLGVGEERCVLVVVGAAGGANLICQLRVFGAQGIRNLLGVFCGALCSSLSGCGGGGVVLSHPSSLTCWGALLPRRRHGGSFPAGFPRVEFTPRILPALERVPAEGGGASELWV